MHGLITPGTQLGAAADRVQSAFVTLAAAVKQRNRLGERGVRIKDERAKVMLSGTPLVQTLPGDANRG
jgi:hypothetical protein